MMQQPQSFLLVDDHEFILSGLSNFITAHFPAARVETAKSAEEAIGKLDGTNWGYVISDVSLPGKNGIELLQTIKEKCPGTKTISLTQHTEIWIIKQLLDVEVNAIVLKENEQHEILKAIKAISENKNYYTEIVYQIIISGLTEKKAPQPTNLPMLTGREIEILKLIAEGLTSKQISEQLFLSEKTVEGHRKNLFVKFDVKNSIMLVRKAMECKFL